MCRARKPLLRKIERSKHDTSTMKENELIMYTGSLISKLRQIMTMRWMSTVMSIKRMIGSIRCTCLALRLSYSRSQFSWRKRKGKDVEKMTSSLWNRVPMKGRAKSCSQQDIFAPSSCWIRLLSSAAVESKKSVIFDCQKGETVGSWILRWLPCQIFNTIVKHTVRYSIKLLRVGAELVSSIRQGTSTSFPLLWSNLRVH